MQRPLIKAGRITNLTDARYYAAHNVHWLGFLYEQNNPESLSIEAFRAIKAWVEGPMVIAEIGFVENSSDYVEEIYDEVDGFQVSAFADIPQKWVDDEKIIIMEAEGYLIENNNLENKIFDSQLTGEKLINWVSKNHPYGLQIKGSEEEKVGYKSYDEIDDFFEYFEV